MTGAPGMTAVYYNDNDRYAAQWLRNLIAAGHIAAGDVDERSIVDVRADDLRGYTQAHFFAGIGGWSHALRLAGWPDDRPVWTGSCPCQPFSAVGAGKAADDERHLWPAWFSLIRERKPPVLFGEQVEAAIGWGWLDAVFADLEQEGYACGSAVLPACGVGAPHIRQRLWFVADAAGERECANGLGQDRRDGQFVAWAGTNVSFSASEAVAREAVERTGASALRLGDASGPGGRRNGGAVPGAQTAGRGERRAARHLVDEFGSPGFWDDCDWLPCTDGKARPVEPGTFPLASRIPNRVGRLRAYGNAIVPQVAAKFIEAYLNGLPFIFNDIQTVHVK